MENLWTGGKDNETYLESYASTEKAGSIVWLLYELQNDEKRLKNTGGTYEYQTSLESCTQTGSRRPEGCRVLYV